MRKILLTFIFICALSFTLFISATAVSGGIVSGSAVNFRSAPSLNSKILYTLQKDDKVILLDKQDDWYKISNKGNIGYMHSDYIEKFDKLITDFGQGIVSGNIVNIRFSAVKDSKIITQLAKNTRITITGIENNYYKITYGDINGYMLSDYITPVKPELQKSKTPLPKVNSPVPVKKTSVLSETASNIIDIAKTLIGIPYLYGGASPDKGFDCSGLVYYVFNKAGISVPRVGFASVGTSIAYSSLKPGDIICFYDNSFSSIGHYGIYIGDGDMIHSPSPGKSVCIETIASGYFNRHFSQGSRVFD